MLDHLFISFKNKIEVYSVQNLCKKVIGCRAYNLGKLEAPDKSYKFY